MDLDGAVVDDVESNAPAPTQGTVQDDSGPAMSIRDSEAKQDFYQMMNDWLTKILEPIQQYNNLQPQLIPLKLLICHEGIQYSWVDHELTRLKNIELKNSELQQVMMLKNLNSG